MDIAAKLGEGREVRAPAPFEDVMINKSFGIMRSLEETSSVSVPAKMVDFYWPDPDNPEEGIVRGELSDDAKAKVEARALASILSLAQDAPMLWWRYLPTWERERDFELNELRFTLRMRGAFVWNEPAVEVHPNG